MNLPDGCELTYTIGKEAWYADCDPDRSPYIDIIAGYPGDGCAWEFQVTEHDLQGPALRVEMFDDAFAAFAQCPELFLALAQQQPTTLPELRALLDTVGARDDTARTDPYAGAS